MPEGPGLAVRQAEVRRLPATRSQVDVNVETLLQDDGNTTPQTHCETVRTGEAGGSGG